VFNLQKWYLDCVTDSGEAVVLYWAVLQWGVFSLHYGSVLHRSRGGIISDWNTFRPGVAPCTSGVDSVIWDCGVLGVRGRWSLSGSPFGRTLLDTDAGQIHWRCICPRAETEILLGGRVLQGFGYAEHLTMTLKPWQLPFEQLRWGRFHSTSNVVVWIEWCGSTECSWVFVNGEELFRARTCSNGVESPDDGVHLSIDAGATLRAGRLTDTALRSLRGLVSLMPGWREAHETKWLARGRLKEPAGVSLGWVVHELVEWV